MTRRLSISQARRMALGAQGFNDPPATGRVDARHFRRVVNRVKLVQLDSVNVLARAHYMPFYSRLGPYPRDQLDRWLWRSGEMFEYWGHVASLIPTADRPLFAGRMKGGWHWPGINRIAKENPGLIDRVYDTIRDNGPVKVGDVDEEARTEAWWGWSDTKMALEYLFLVGKLTVADRPNFTRVYDLPERVHPEALAFPAVDPTEAAIGKVRRSINALGVATVADLADYYRLKMTTIRPLVKELVAAGEMEEVTVEGWSEPGYADPAAPLPRSIDSSGFLSPFDPVVWFRPRSERLFDFHYRIEIYTPAPKRIYGYYVLPYRIGERMAGRADLKADRKTGRLLVQGAFHEPDEMPGRVADRMAGDLRQMAEWLGLEVVQVNGKGNLAGELASRVPTVREWT